jgi:hypothetical protein
MFSRLSVKPPATDEEDLTRLDQGSWIWIFPHRKVGYNEGYNLEEGTCPLPATLALRVRSLWPMAKRLQQELQ